MKIPQILWRRTLTGINHAAAQFAAQQDGPAEERVEFSRVWRFTLDVEVVQSSVVGDRMVDSAELTIDGSGHPGLVISGGGGALRPFVVTSSLTLENLTISGGVANGGSGGDSKNGGNGGGGGGGGGGGLGAGGCVYVDGGSFYADGVTFTNNLAHGGEGGARSGTVSNTGGGGGGLGIDGHDGNSGGAGGGAGGNGVEGPGGR